jgi:hypothetical protein
MTLSSEGNDNMTKAKRLAMHLVEHGGVPYVEATVVRRGVRGPCFEAGWLVRTPLLEFFEGSGKTEYLVIQGGAREGRLDDLDEELAATGVNFWLPGGPDLDLDHLSPGTMCHFAKGSVRVIERE